MQIIQKTKPQKTNQKNKKNKKKKQKKTTKKQFVTHVRAQFPCQKNFLEKKTDQNWRKDIQLTPTQMFKK